jgi:hypothetical protein
MITNAILYILYGFIYLITAPIRLFSDVSLPAAINDSISSIGSNLALLNQVIPVSTIITILGIMLAIESAIFIYKGIRWIYNKIPGVN